MSWWDAFTLRWLGMSPRIPLEFHGVSLEFHCMFCGEVTIQACTVTLMGVNAHFAVHGRL